MMGTLHERSAAVHHLGEIAWVLWIPLGKKCLIGFGQPLPTMLHQQVIILTWHGNIDIVVPRDEPL